MKVILNLECFILMYKIKLELTQVAWLIDWGRLLPMRAVYIYLIFIKRSYIFRCCHYNVEMFKNVKSVYTHFDICIPLEICVYIYIYIILWMSSRIELLVRFDCYENRNFQINQRVGEREIFVFLGHWIRGRSLRKTITLFTPLEE